LSRKWKRKKYIVDRDFQYTFIRKIAILTLFIIIGSLFTLVSVYHYYGDVRVEIAQPLPSLLSDSVKAINDFQSYSIFDLFWPVLTACVVVTLLFTIVYGVIISHRMAGPIYRMRQILAKMAKYDLSGPSENTRRKDEFKSLLADLNNLKEQLRRPILELQTLCQEMDADTVQKQHVHRIHEIISQFKTTA